MGWTHGHAPGFPKNWKVSYEGLLPMPKGFGRGMAFAARLPLVYTKYLNYNAENAPFNRITVTVRRLTGSAHAWRPRTAVRCWRAAVREAARKLTVSSER